MLWKQMLVVAVLALVEFGGLAAAAERVERRRVAIIDGDHARAIYAAIPELQNTGTDFAEIYRITVYEYPDKFVVLFKLGASDPNFVGDSVLEGYSVNVEVRMDTNEVVQWYYTR